MSADANLVAGWERSAGLRAPPAPAEGALVPKGSGYLLAVGSPAQRLFPGAVEIAGWVSALAVPVIAAMPFLLVPAPYGVAGVAGLAALACWLPTKVVAGLARVLLGRHLEAASQGGRLVRLAGVVAEQKTVPSLFTGRPVVLAASGCAGVTETRGFDFDVRLDDGMLVRVPARDAVLLGRRQRVRGQPSCGPVTLTLASGEARLCSALLADRGWIDRLLDLVTHELTLGPGDRVEICGALDLQPDEVTQHGFDRDSALRAVLRPVDGVPIIVRKR